MANSSAKKLANEDYWIFIVKEYTDYNMGSIDETIKKITKGMKWPIGRKTRYRNRLKRGDLVLIYLSGVGKQEFISHARLGSALIENKGELFDYVIFRRFVAWDKRLKIKSFINEFEFIKNKQKWWSHFQGGIIKITKKDYQRILSAAM